MAKLPSSIAVCYKKRVPGLRAFASKLAAEFKSRTGRKIKMVGFRDYREENIWRSVDYQLELPAKVLIFAFTPDSLHRFSAEVSGNEEKWLASRHARNLTTLSVVRAGAVHDSIDGPTGLFDECFQVDEIDFEDAKVREGTGFARLLSVVALESGEKFREKRVLPISDVCAQTYGSDAPRLPSSTNDKLALEVESSSGSSQPDGSRIYPVWFGTNRSMLADYSGFSNERSQRVTWGKVHVRIPKAHRFGEIGTGWFRKLMRRNFACDTLSVSDVQVLSRGEALSGIRNSIALARKTDELAHAMVFIHGFNVSFEEAAIRAAQLGVDLKVPGCTAFFSWPSRGTVEDYMVDEATIEASEEYLTEFLTQFASGCGADKIHIIAHSMGNRGLLRALQRVVGRAEESSTIRFGQIFLAAPDIDRDLFLSLSHLYRRVAEKTTLYSSRRDLAVWASKKLHSAARAGYFEPYTVADGVDSIVVPDFNLDLLGHGYFAEAEALLYDIRNVMLSSRPPEQRQRIEPLHVAGTSLWQFVR